MIRIDTNYIIRYLINDDIKMANKAEKVIKTEQIFIANEIFAEVVYVLLGVYKISKEDIANEILSLIEFENISVSNYKIIKKAFEIFKSKNLDFVDCLLCAYSKYDEILSYDKKLNTCINERANKA